MDSNHSRSHSSNLIWTLPSFINSDLQTILGNKKMGDKSHFLKVGTVISIYVAQYFPLGKVTGDVRHHKPDRER